MRGLRRWHGGVWQRHNHQGRRLPFHLGLPRRGAPQLAAHRLHAVEAPDDPEDLPVQVVELLLGLPAPAEDVELDLEQVLRLGRAVDTKAAVNEVADAHGLVRHGLQVAEEVVQLVPRESQLVELLHQLWGLHALLEARPGKRALAGIVGVFHGLEEGMKGTGGVEVLLLRLLRALARRAREHALDDHARDDVQEHDVRQADEGDEEEPGEAPAGEGVDRPDHLLPVLKRHQLK
mmetsp:Transcript_24372/g.69874  ORF Transcript_24372/g.69874 Transcript_24372/m.69874 type:complete len:234 (+) Transcript_24372:407-1108(+)